VLDAAHMTSPILSICIPTFNRAQLLDACLNSIIEEAKGNEKLEICVSDNASRDNTVHVLEKYKHIENFSHFSNEFNIGIPRNFMNVVSMAKGKFIWLVGDDDIVIPGALNQILECIETNTICDFFLFNSINLEDRASLKKDNTIHDSVKVEHFWNSGLHGQVEFEQLISRNVTFDHLGGMYLSIFRRKTWLSSESALDYRKIRSAKQFSSHDNTFPHVRIFAKGFMKKKAFIKNIPIVYSFSDAREWKALYPLIRSVRLLESLDYYKDNGLPEDDYHKLKSKSLRYFAEDMLRITFFKKWYWGAEYINIKALLRENIVYSGFWISVANVVLKGCKKISKNLNGRLK
jgi:glycosyltransferase involved in cell wall biosynthesis